MRQDRAYNHQGQHRQGVCAAAREDPVGNIEKVDWDSQNEDIDEEREDRNRNQVAAARRQALVENLPEVSIA
jgi:hypothetical protein